MTGYWRSAIIAACMAVSVGSVQARDLTPVEIDGDEAILHVLGLFLADPIACLQDDNCPWTNQSPDTEGGFTLVGTSGAGQLWSWRAPAGEEGTTGQGLHLYFYGIDLNELRPTAPFSSCVQKVSIPFSGDIIPLDYDDNGELENAFIFASPDEQTPASVRLEGNFLEGFFLKMFFDPALCRDRSPALGVASSSPPEQVQALIVDTFGNEQRTEALSPKSLVQAACVDPTKTDPATGAPLSLPISRWVPACRCFESGAAREWHCGILHPDFIAIRRMPLPIQPGKPYEEIWNLVPLGKLDGSVRVTIKSDGFEKPVELELPATSKLPDDHTRPNFGVGAGQTFTLKAMAPDKPGAVPGIAVFEYDMKDAKDESLKSFGLDISLDKSLFKQ
jgi:hypothetical protein